MNSVEELVESIKKGQMVILLDDEDRENEGDLILAADHATPAAINFMATEARGLICLALAPEKVDKLRLPLMVREDQNLSPNKTAFTVSIEASHGVSTGISAADRAHTIKVAANPEAKPADLHTPGHIFPIRAQPGGVLRRPGHTEASVDLMTLAGLNRAAVICEVMNPDGTMARLPDLVKFAEKHDIRIGTIVDLIQYRLAHDSLVKEVYTKTLDKHSLGEGDVQLKVFQSTVDQREHLVVVKGDISGQQVVPVRMHMNLMARDIYHNLTQGSSWLEKSLALLKDKECGVFVLLETQSSIPSLTRLLNSDFGLHELDSRDYGIGAQLLRALGLKKIQLISSRPERRVGLRAFGLEIVE